MGFLVAVPLIEQSFIDESREAIIKTIHAVFEGKQSEYGFQWVYMVFKFVTKFLFF